VLSKERSYSKEHDYSVELSRGLFRPTIKLDSLLHHAEKKATASTSFVSNDKKHSKWFEIKYLMNLMTKPEN